MGLLNCECRNNCSVVSIIASIIIGVITAMLRITAVITITPAFLWVLLGIAVVYLALTPIITAVLKSVGSKGCICTVLPVLLTGILGTILTSIVLLAIEFVATSIISAIISGALLTFFSLTVTTFACFAKCAARCNNDNTL